jgi:hypothetical protein
MPAEKLKNRPDRKSLTTQVPSEYFHFYNNGLEPKRVLALSTPPQGSTAAMQLRAG